MFEAGGDGSMTMASAFGEDRVVNWVKVTDKAGWQPRDSQGEVVYKDQLWILGGWYDSFKPCPRDVWSSCWSTTIILPLDDN